MKTFILLSIKSEFAERILQGEKKYEFRRNIFRQSNVEKVLIYASSPVKRIIGEFEIDDILSLELDLLWTKTSYHAGVNKDFFDKYFYGKSIGNAIKIRNAKRYALPLELSFFNIKHAPQSFIYLNQT
jgi:predicted transcriptional regulator